MSTDRLIDAVFDGDPPEAARRTFRTYVAATASALEVAGVDASLVLVTEAKGTSFQGSIESRLGGVREGTCRRQGSAHSG